MLAMKCGELLGLLEDVMEVATTDLSTIHTTKKGSIKEDLVFPQPIWPL